MALRERLEQGDPNADELRTMNTYLMAELEWGSAYPGENGGD